MTAPAMQKAIESIRKYANDYASTGFFREDGRSFSKADTATADAVVILLTALVGKAWRSAVSEVRSEELAGIVEGVSPRAAVVARLLELLRGKMGGKIRIDVAAGVEVIHEAAFGLLTMWHPEGEAAPRRVMAETLPSTISGRPTDLEVALRSLEGVLEEAANGAKSRALGRPVEDLFAELEAVSEDVGDKRSSLSVGIDAWAYNELAAGIVAQAPEGSDFVLWNPLDSKTSAYCRSVAGMVITAETMRRSILPVRRFQPTQAVSFEHTSPASKAPQRLPPYHPACRTYLVPAAYYAKFRPIA